MAFLVRAGPAAAAACGPQPPEGYCLWVCAMLHPTAVLVLCRLHYMWLVFHPVFIRTAAGLKSLQLAKVCAAAATHWMVLHAAYACRCAVPAAGYMDCSA